MIDYGRVRSTVKPAPTVIDDFSVWENADIQEVRENVGEDNEFVGYEYTMRQYTKDEFIMRQSRENAAMQSSIGDLEVAVLELYENSL